MRKTFHRNVFTLLRFKKYKVFRSLRRATKGLSETFNFCRINVNMAVRYEKGENYGK